MNFFTQSVAYIKTNTYLCNIQLKQMYNTLILQNMRPMKDFEREYVNNIYSILHYRSNAILCRGNWGATDFVATIYNEMPALRFKVRGGKHKGFIVVAYNEGRDTFEVYVIKHSQKRSPFLHYVDTELEHIEDVYCDNMMYIIDSRVCEC